MKLYYYIPYILTYYVVQILDFFTKKPNPNIRWMKYFGSGFTQDNYCSYMDDIKSKDQTTYWIMLIAPNTAAISVILVIISLISKVG